MMTPSYPDLLQVISDIGIYQPSQHGITREVLLMQVISEAGELERRDNINYSIGYMEGMQLIAGVYNIAAMIEVAPNASHKLFTLPMAYGPRLATQMPNIVEKLRQDPDTRQAIAFIGKPEDGQTNNQPCTTTLQWLLRKDHVVCVGSMRSWDLIKGLPYDLMMFHMATAAVAHCLGVKPGPVCVTAGSGHIYERDAERKARMSSGRVLTIREDMPREWVALQSLAQEMVWNTQSWNAAQGMRHIVPPMFEETLTVQDTDATVSVTPFQVPMDNLL